MTYTKVGQKTKWFRQIWRCSVCELNITERRGHKHLSKKLLKEIKEMEDQKI